MSVNAGYTKDLSIVVPIYNEEKGIPELVQRLRVAASSITENFELVFVNDGSRDGSLELLRRECSHDDRFFYINLSRNFGHQIAVSAGLDHVKGKATVIIDGDLQDPPELIPEMYAKYREGYEVVYAQRKHREGETLFKKATAKAFYRTMRKITSIDMPLDTGDFRLIDWRIVQCLRDMPEQNKFLRGQIAWMGFRQTGVLFDRDERKYGKTNYPLRKMLGLAIDGITGFSSRPLEWVTKLGALVSLLSFFVIIYALISHFLLDKTVSGWTSVIVSSMFLGGGQLICLGVIGTYISRINKNIVGRPLYLVAETNIAANK
ncbi:glycosyltransferase family 2 protein [Porphyromonas loveana]|uniref:glycosyltransferase family 2 protein n=1 Tax=Porphyromonas loveana TaxID=1884669 RepID=UPI0035A017B4